MSEIRPSVWIGAGLACAAALALVGGSLWGGSSGRSGERADAAGELAAAARPQPRVWPPRGPAPALPALPPRREPVTQENLRELRVAEEAAVRLVVAHGLDGGVEIPDPPRRPGESAVEHRRRADALRRHALADVLLSHMQMRDYYASTALPEGGLPSRIEIREVRMLPSFVDVRERTAALRSAASRLDELVELGLAPEYAETSL